jgi:hypothetical protein
MLLEHCHPDMLFLEDGLGESAILLKQQLSIVLHRFQVFGVTPQEPEHLKVPVIEHLMVVRCIHRRFLGMEQSEISVVFAQQ